MVICLLVNFLIELKVFIFKPDKDDEIEYIKLNPTSEKFNATIKRSQFDQPMLNLISKFGPHLSKVPS